MELMFAEWEDGERFSFEDSDHFEEDSLCSFISEAESLCQNWRGWRKQSAGPNSPTVKMKGEVTRCPRAVRWPCGSCGVRGRCWAGRSAEVPAVQREVKRRLVVRLTFEQRPKLGIYWGSYEKVVFWVTSSASSPYDCTSAFLS